MNTVSDVSATLAVELRTAEKALREARQRWYESLPEFPADGHCLFCDNDGTEFGDWQHIEEGYSRWTNGSFEDGVLRLPTNGWDDYSDQGEFEWVECNAYQAGHPEHCGAAYALPEDMEWN